MALTKLVVFDVAGTTAKDDGLVVKAFQNAITSMGISPDSSEFGEMTDYVNATMGQRKIDVFTHLFGGDEIKAHEAHDRFVVAYMELVANGELEEFEGISDFFRILRSKEVGVAITTGFPREILDLILAKLGWNEVIDVSVAASEVASGRPAPDMILKSLEIFSQLTSSTIGLDQVIVVGDTESDVESGVRAGVSTIVGVTSGARSRDSLEAAGATHVFAYATKVIGLIA
ncbi:MAG: HAD hydrolase-like protein [Actinomycetes bacterium]